MKKSTSGEDGGGSERKCGLNLVKLVSVFLVLSVLFWVSVVVQDPPSDGLYFKLGKGIAEENDGEGEQLLPIGLDEKSCLSRYQLPLYRRGEARKPSPHLISKLRSYEARHRRCGTYTNSYNKTVELLKSGTYDSTAPPDCKYIVWISLDGLGNKMLTLASAFLYALLTDRVLLVDRGIDIPDLFCDPFPEASWFLPLDFPFTHQFSGFNQQSKQSYGNQLKTNSTASPPYPPYMYLFLANNCDHHDKLFFCDQHQTYLHNIPWLILKTNQYITPALFLIPSFQQELHSLFPDKETVFHLLGRYLLHPTNSVWGIISRFYEAYLSKADVIAGIQVRVYENNGPFTNEQILSCTKRESILPQISEHPIKSNTTTTTTVAVVMVSLSSGYFERVRELYLENPTETGEVVGVFQPSHEVYQQTERPTHNRKALAEIYLLSLTDKDKLVTSGFSTFGYVAQALAGVKPWILYTPKDQTVPDPPCGRGVSLEPCYHTPPNYDCKTGREVDTGGVVPYVRHCEDVWGIKLY